MSERIPGGKDKETVIPTFQLLGLSVVVPRMEISVQCRIHGKQRKSLACSVVFQILFINATIASLYNDSKHGREYQWVFHNFKYNNQVNQDTPDKNPFSLVFIFVS